MELLFSFVRYKASPPFSKGGLGGIVYITW